MGVCESGSLLEASVAGHLVQRRRAADGSASHPPPQRANSLNGHQDASLVPNCGLSLILSRRNGSRPTLDSRPAATIPVGICRLFRLQLDEIRHRVTLLISPRTRSRPKMAAV